MRLLMLVIAAAAAGCAFFPQGARLSVSGSGTFECGSGFHGCTAWLAIRPASWTAPAGWAPGLADRDLRPQPTATDASRWVVSGSGSGGPERIEAGDYVFIAAFTEADDTTPYVLGTDEQPGTGILGTTIACSANVTVPQGATELAVRVSFSPCAIEATPAP